MGKIFIISSTIQIYVAPISVHYISKRFSNRKIEKQKYFKIKYFYKFEKKNGI